jgi:hypothetical protein
MIPKIIHLVWIGDVTQEVTVDAYRRLNPEHEVRLHTDHSELNPLYREVWDRHTPVVTMKSDLLRWSLLEKHGGWYFDVDCLPLVPVHDMESHYGLTGRQMFLTVYRSLINTDILAVAPNWDGWDPIHRYILSYRRDSLGQSYLCFSWDMIHAIALQSGDRHRWILGNRERFNWMPESGIEPFVLRRLDVARYLDSLKEQDSRLANGSGIENGASTRSPRLTRRIGSYATALGRWIAAGRPERPEEEVQRIFQSLCQPCEFFDAARGSCRVCGCRLRQEGAALTNKIKMATEHCPKDKW